MKPCWVSPAMASVNSDCSMMFVLLVYVSSALVGSTSLVLVAGTVQERQCCDGWFSYASAGPRELENLNFQDR